jgi:hypothetical protein
VESGRITDKKSKIKPVFIYVCIQQFFLLVKIGIKWNHNKKGGNQIETKKKKKKVGFLKYWRYNKNLKTR